MHSIDNMLIKSPCGSGKKYKNCCGKNAYKIYYEDGEYKKIQY